MKPLQQLNKKITGIITAVLFTAAYALGIGVVAVFVKMSGTSMLHTANQKTSWQKPTGSNRLEKMF